MKVAVFYGPGDIKIEERPKPDPGVDGVVVKIKDCGICGYLDVPLWETNNGMGRGSIRGHEWSGEIVEVGSNVTDFHVGERIYMEPVFRPCYRCEACLQKDYAHCSNRMAGGPMNGAFAEYMLIPFVTKEATIKYDDKLSFRDLALVEPLCLSVGVAKKAKPGENILVLGQHLVGLGMTAYLKKYMDVAKVITGSVSEKHLKASEGVGADIALDSIEDDIAKVVMRETKRKGADQVIVTDPRPAALMQALNSVKASGIIWLTNYTFPIRLHSKLQDVPRYMIGMDWHGPVEPPISSEPSFAYIKGAWGTLGERMPRFLEALKLIESGAITAEKHVSHIFPLDKIKEAYDVAADYNESTEVMIEI